MHEWTRLARELPGVGLDWCGGLIWDLPPDQLEVFAAEHGTWGYDLQRVNVAGALRLEPGLQHAPEYALYAAQEGKVEPLVAALALLAAAQSLGATLHTGTQVGELVQRNGRVVGVRANADLLEADEVVLAVQLCWQAWGCTTPLTHRQDCWCTPSPRGRC
jgi:glycine/D-amino acid oxidase-like deaminating enzyme